MAPSSWPRTPPPAGQGVFWPSNEARSTSCRAETDQIRQDRIWQRMIIASGVPSTKQVTEVRLKVTKSRSFTVVGLANQAEYRIGSP